MRYYAVFISEMIKENDMLRLKLVKEGEQFTGKMQLVLVKKDEEEYIFSEKEVKIEAVKNKEMIISVSFSRFFKVLPADNARWEVYLQAGDTRYRLEHTKNKGRKRYQSGKKVKPYQERKGVYDASDQCMEAFFIPGESIGKEETSKAKENSFALLPRLSLIHISEPTRH